MTYFFKQFTLMFFLLIPCAFSYAGQTDAAHFFDDTFGDFQEELQNARDQEKHAILIMFEMDECPFCHRMKQTVLNQTEVQKYFRDAFLIFSVDIEGDIEIINFSGKATTQKKFAIQHKVRATPVFAFFDLDGKLIKRAKLTGATNGPDEFMLLGKYVIDRVYENTSFTRYKRASTKG